MLATGPQELLPLYSRLIIIIHLHITRVRAAQRFSKARVGGLLDSSRDLLYNSECCDIMTTTSQTPRWVLKKAVLVYASDFETFCRADLSIVHDQAASQGSISLSIRADLTNLSGRSQTLTLNIPPERVEECTLARKSRDNLFPAGLFSMLPAPVTNVSAVSTLSLSLGTTGIVLCPSEIESLSPAAPGDVKIHSFAKICRSRSLRIHFSGRQFVNNELDKLQNFSHALQRRSLQTVSFNHARHGVVEKDWRVFSLLPDPPPYCQEPVFEQADPPLYCEETVGKRRRGISSFYRFMFPYLSVAQS